MDRLTDFIQDAAYNISYFENESDLEGEMTLNDGCNSMKVIYSLEKIKIKEYKSGKYKLYLPFWKTDFEKIFQILLRYRASEIFAEQAEQDRLEYEEKCRKHELINYAGSMAGY